MLEQERWRRELKQFEYLMSNIVGGIQICQNCEPYTISYINEGFTNITGYSPKDVSGMRPSDFVAPQDKQWAAEECQRQIADTGMLHVEYRIRRKDGKIIWVLVNSVTFEPTDGNSYIQSIYTDITEQHRREEELLISDKRYEIALGFTDFTIFEYNITNGQLVNHYTDLADYGLPKIMDNAVESFISMGVVTPDSADAFRGIFQRVIDGEPFSQGIIRAIDVKGNENILSIKLTTIYDSDGLPVRAVGVKKDITYEQHLRRESEYGNTFAAERLMVFEANVTLNQLTTVNNSRATALDLLETASLSSLVDAMAATMVDPSGSEFFRQQLSLEHITETFESGHRLFSFEYRQRQENGEYFWTEATVNIIREETTGYINIRCYEISTEERRGKELRIQEERRFYESMSLHSLAVFESNITNNLVISGNESWAKDFGVPTTKSYSDMIATLNSLVVQPEYRGLYFSTFSRENVLTAFTEGKTELKCDYKTHNRSGALVWVRCTMHLYEAPQTGDVCCFTYVEDINEQKLREISLIYKSEHDLLTGFYNKATTQELIDSFLASAEAKSSMHAFMIIDIDRFKTINDVFGHAFGDVVISQVSSKINELFRSDDIRGRIGGDEFVVLMKNINHHKTAASKAQEMCEHIFETYTQRGNEYNISLSVGVAFFDEHGSNYAELYHNSDTALYNAKELGRNRFSLYSSKMLSQNLPPHEIDNSNMLEPKKFEKNIGEYIFRILYESTDKEAAINSMLELIGKHYRVSRAYIFEDSHEGEFTSNTFEWCAEGIASEISHLQNIPNEACDYPRHKFSPEGIYFINDVNTLSTSARTILEPQSIQSMLLFSMEHDGEYVGFVGFDECTYHRMPSSQELSELRHISNILTIFILELRAAQRNAELKKLAFSMINALDSYAYVCDPDTCEMLFINRRTASLSPNAKVGGICYRDLWGKSTQCEECPMLLNAVFDDGTPASHSRIVHGAWAGKELRVTASWIDWEQRKKACLINCIELTPLLTDDKS